MRPEDRGVVPRSRFVQRLDESPDLGRRDQQVACQLPTPGIAIGVPSCFERQDRTARTGLRISSVSLRHQQPILIQLPVLG